MTELRLDFQVPDFWGCWSQVEEDEEGEAGSKLPGSEASQASLLTDSSTFSMDLNAGVDVSSEPFPCLADELEQQAKALERDWFAPIQPLVPAPSPARLRPVSLLLSNPPAAAAAAALRRSAALPLPQLQPLRPSGAAAPAGALTVPVAPGVEGVGCGCGNAGGEEGEEGGAQPATPTRRSNGHHSSWNESQCALRADPQEVQSPVRPPPLLEPPTAPRRAIPLALAVDNAGSVRLGRQPLVADAWRGCSQDPWCNREAHHSGPCNSCASVPGLLAYSQGQLFESGVNVEELCRAPELAEAALASLRQQRSRSVPLEAVPAVPTPLAEGVALGKRPAESEADACADLHSGAAAQHSQPQPATAAAVAAASSGSHPPAPLGSSGSSEALSSHSQLGSGMGGAFAEQRSGSEVQGAPAPLLPLPQRAARAKRQRLGPEAASEEEDGGQQKALSSGQLHSEDSTGHVVRVHLAREASVAFAGPLEAMLPGAALFPAAEAAAEQAAAEAAAAAAAAATEAPRAAAASRGGLRAKAGGRHGSRARPAPAAPAAPLAAAEAALGAAEQAAATQQQLKATGGRGKGSTPSKAPARQTPKTPESGAPRSNQRRTILHWNSEQVTDPRSGQVVYSVDPATFCTQCFVTHTPVWRAGPFGHKTLCNACGVRYMKYAKAKK